MKIKTFTLVLGLLILASWVSAKADSKVALSAPVSTSVISPTPVPIDYDLWLTFRELMLDDNCTLPCWWGLYIGKSTIETVLTFLQRNDFDRSWQELGEPVTLERYARAGETFGMEFEYPLRTEVDSFWIWFDFDDKGSLLESISMTFNGPLIWLPPEVDRVTLPKILTRMNSVPEIYISDKSRPSDISMLVVYPEEGVEITYSFDLWDDTRDRVVPLCFNRMQTGRIHINIHSPDNELYVEELNSIRESEHRESFAEFFGYDVASLIAFYTEQPDGCIEKRPDAIISIWD